jgi:hypothetical protein
MQLYSKKLHTLDELEREKRKLRKEVKRMDKEPFIAKLKGQTVVDEDREEKAGGGLSFLSGPVSVMALKMIGRYMGRKRATPVPLYKAEAIHSKKKSLAKVVLYEVVGGYLKWKAIELTYKGIKTLIKKNNTPS